MSNIFSKLAGRLFNPKVIRVFASGKISRSLASNINNYGETPSLQALNQSKKGISLNTYPIFNQRIVLSPLVATDLSRWATLKNIPNHRYFSTKSIESASEISKQYQEFESISKQYTPYYALGKDGLSLYDRQYGKDNILQMDKDLLASTALSSADFKVSQGVFNILEHGGGNGRYYTLLSKINSDLKAKFPGKVSGTTVTVEDISKEGLEIYKNKLVENGFSVIGGDPLHEIDISRPEGERGYIGPVLEKKATGEEFRLIHIDEHDSQEHIRQLECIGNIKFDMITTMFGPIAHIVRESARNAVLKRFADSLDSNGYVVGSVPSPNRFKEELAAYEMFRRQHLAPKAFEEKRTLAYAKFTGEDTSSEDLYPKPDALIPYCIFPSADLRREIKNGGLSLVGDLGINFLHPNISELLNDRVKAEKDAYESKKCTSELQKISDEKARNKELDKVAHYIQFVAKPTWADKIDAQSKNENKVSR